MGPAQKRCNLAGLRASSAASTGGTATLTSAVVGTGGEVVRIGLLDCRATGACGSGARLLPKPTTLLCTIPASGRAQLRCAGSCTCQ